MSAMNIIKLVFIHLVICAHIQFNISIFFLLFYFILKLSLSQKKKLAEGKYKFLRFPWKRVSNYFPFLSYFWNFIFEVGKTIVNR